MQLSGMSTSVVTPPDAAADEPGRQHELAEIDALVHPGGLDDRVDDLDDGAVLDHDGGGTEHLLREDAARRDGQAARGFGHARGDRRTRAPGPARARTLGSLARTVPLSARRRGRRGISGANRAAFFGRPVRAYS
jgi:hypothetical protein